MIRIVKNDLIKDLENIEHTFSSENMAELSNIAVNFFIDSFNNQGFTDEVLIPWQKSNKDVGATLVLSGQLRNSIRADQITDNGFSIISDMDYSDIHNEGGLIPVTASLRSMFWFLYSKTGEEKYKWLALTKLSYFTIPKRQFMGESAQLERKINEFIKNKIERNE